jgi:hypothetical protein
MKNQKLALVTESSATFYEIYKGKVKSLGGCSIESYFDWIKSKCDLSTPILPDGTKYYKEINNRIYLTIERPPEKVKYLRHNIHLPYVQYHMKIAKIADQYRIDSLRITFTNSPFLDNKQPLYSAPLQNIHSTYIVCTGDAMSSVNGKSLHSLCRDVIILFWNSGWSNDYPDMLLDNTPKSFSWSKITTAKQALAVNWLNPATIKEVYES